MGRKPAQPYDVKAAGANPITRLFDAYRGLRQLRSLRAVAAIASYVCQTPQSISLDLGLSCVAGYSGSSFVKGLGKLPVPFNQSDVSPDIESLGPGGEQDSGQTVEYALDCFLAAHSHQVRTVISQNCGRQFLRGLAVVVQRRVPPAGLSTPVTECFV